MDVQGKVVVLTGASAGIGLETARIFAQNGAKQALVARSTEALEKLSNELKQKGAEAIVITADMTNKDDVERMISQAFDHFGRIDILINNAGQSATGPVASVNNDNYRKIVELNVFGPLYAMQAVVPRMRQNGGGIIINISSMVSFLRIPTIGAYASTKYALNALSQTARVELAEDNIRVLTVYPGQTSTGFSKNSLQDASSAGLEFGQRGDSPVKVASKILEAAQKEPRDQFMGRFPRLFSFVATVLPGVLDKQLANRVRSSSRPAEQASDPAKS